MIPGIKKVCSLPLPARVGVIAPPPAPFFQLPVGTLSPRNKVRI
jgi:hypothetical protein